MSVLPRPRPTMSGWLHRSMPPESVPRLTRLRVQFGADPTPYAPLPADPPWGMSAIIYQRRVAEIRMIEQAAGWRR